MPFVFSNDLRDDWRRRAVRNGLIEEQYGLSHDQVLAAAHAETAGTYNYSFRNVVTSPTPPTSFDPTTRRTLTMTSARRWPRSNRDGDRDAKNSRTSCFLQSRLVRSTQAYLRCGACLEHADW